MSTVVLEDSDTVVSDVKTAEFILNVMPEVAVVESETTAFVSQEKVETIVVSVEASTVVVAGHQGPPGPAGQAEEDVVYSKRIDFINDNLLYKGEAVVGSSESNPVWRIRKITVGNDGDVTEVWASGSADFLHAWTARLGYTYS